MTYNGRSWDASDYEIAQIEIARLKAELAEARRAMRRMATASKVTRGQSVLRALANIDDIARDFLAKHPEPDPPS